VNQHFSAIIVAAGSSRRLGFDKLIVPLNGRPALAHSIAAFASSAADEIIIVTLSERIAEFTALCADAGFAGVKIVPTRGPERRDSVAAGIAATNPTTEWIAVHDGARPLISNHDIAGCLKLAIQTGAAACAAPVADTLVRATADQHADAPVDRTGLWAMQTPQIFKATLLRAAYDALGAASADAAWATDEVSVVRKFGAPVAIYPTHDWNFKITLPQDIRLADHVLAIRRHGASELPDHPAA